jgi:hypothetical protein
MEMAMVVLAAATHLFRFLATYSVYVPQTTRFLFGKNQTGEKSKKS